MGLTSSKGRDNDDLIDKLVEQNLIVTKRVEKAMRLVDRGRFFLPADIEMAYKDMAWRTELEGTVRLHLSAPCIYANALEHLELSEGLSFLNIGSGTGFFSTIVGYMIGSGGHNHGIEIHESLCEYARKKVEDTVKLPETQCVDWAPPEFTCGNGLSLSSSHFGKYDRVYCGASVPSSHKRMLWELLKIGGILVMPYDDQLQQVRRRTQDEYEVRVISSVSFSDFVVPDEDSPAEAFAPTMRQVSTLQRLCCLAIRRAVRECVAKKFPIHMRCVAQENAQSRRYPQPIIVFRENVNEQRPPGHDEHRQFFAFIGNAERFDESDSSSGSSSEEEELPGEREEMHFGRVRRRHPAWAQRLGARIARVVQERRGWRRNRRMNAEQEQTEAHRLLEEADQVHQAERAAAEARESGSKEQTTTGEETVHPEETTEGDLGNQENVTESSVLDAAENSLETNERQESPLRDEGDKPADDEDEATMTSAALSVGRSGKRPREASDGEASDAKRRSDISAQKKERTEGCKKGETASSSIAAELTESDQTSGRKGEDESADNEAEMRSNLGNSTETEAAEAMQRELDETLEEMQRNELDEREWRNVEEFFVRDTRGTSPSDDDSDAAEKKHRAQADEEEEKKEGARLEDCQKQRHDLNKFAAEFDRRIDHLPISKPLIKIVKHFSKVY